MKVRVFLITLFLFSLFISCATYQYQEDFNQGEFRIAAVGDSITYGLGIPHRFQNSYPAQLDRMLDSRWVVGNFGKSGATLLREGDRPYIKTREYLDALEFEPDLVIIMLGTNDSKLQNREHIDDFTSDYLELISSFQALNSNPQICICYPVPAFGGLYHIDDSIIGEMIIPAINKAAEKSGVLLLDLNSVLTSQGHLFPDTVHPDKEGARVIAKHIFTSLHDVLGNISISQSERILY